MDSTIIRGEQSASDLRFNIRAWSAWGPGVPDDAPLAEWLAGEPAVDDGGAPDIGFVSTMLRRRLERSARMALHVAHRASGGLERVRTVFASRHGELARTVQLLHSLAASELPSPASFSLSVHNATAGIFSIARGDTSPATAIAAGEETLLWALQEAALRLHDDASAPVLVVYADDVWPSEYAQFGGTREEAFALALLLEKGAAVEVTWDASAGATSPALPLPKAFAAWWAGRDDVFEWAGERLTIRGRKRD